MTGDDTRESGDGWQVFEADSQDEAVAEAVRALGIPEDDLEIVTEEADDGVRVRVRRAGEADEGDTARGRSRSAPDPELIAEQQNLALDFLEEMLEAFDLEAEIASEVRDGTVFVDVNGEELGSLIGRRGSTLAALTEVCKTVVQRRTASRVRLQLDVQGYRARRRAALEKYVLELADEVADSRVEKALEPMSAADRKVVHDAVAKVDGVRSYSEGSEPKRSVVITPV